MDDTIIVSFTPDYIPPLPKEGNIVVSFTPDYLPPLPTEGNILVSFTPKYQPPLPTEGNILVSFTPDYYAISSSTDGIVNLSYKQATLLGETTTPYIIIEPTTTEKGIIAISSASESGFGVFSELYDIGPTETVFIPTATLTFIYSEPPFDETLLDIYRWEQTEWQKLTAVERDTANNWIKVELSDIACIFALLYKIPDITPPVTELKVLGDYYVSADTQNYVSSRSSFCLTAYDPVVNGISSEMDYTEFRIDNDIFWNVYEGTFTLTQYISTDTLEGEHTIGYRSRDRKGNIEEEKVFAFLVDVEPPLTELKVESSKLKEHSGIFYVTGDARFYLEAEDKSPLYSPFEKEGNSGVKKIGYWIDEEEYHWRIVVDTSQPLNVGIPEDFPSQYFAEGSHKIGYRSIDNVNNIEPTAIREIYCDKSPPQITIVSPKAGEIYIAKKSTITIDFTVTDNSDPEPEISAYLFNVEKSSAIAVVKNQTIEPLDIESGFWTLIIEATDWMGHFSSSTTGQFEVIHDILPPRTEIVAGQPRYITETSTFVARETQFNLSAVDDMVEVGDAIGLGVEETRYSINQGTFSVYTSSFTLYEEGENIIKYYSSDTVGNTEEENSLLVIGDFSEPQTEVSISEPKYKNYITSRSSVVLIAEDKGVIPSGVKETKYSINNGAFAFYASPFTLYGNDGIYTVDYYSRDNVLNQEIIKSTTIKVDNTAPETALSVGAPQYEAGGKIYISEETGITLSAIDPVINEVASGLQYTEYRVNGAVWQTYSTPLTLTEGIRVLEYRSIDNVKNTEQIKSITLHVDETAPESNLTAGTPRYQSGDNLYVTSSTIYTLTTVDPIINEVAAGVDYAEYNVDGGEWAKKVGPVTDYQLPVTLSEGERIIYFKGTDNVENKEAEKSLTVLVDNTAPETTLAISQPKYIVDGSTYITSNSEVILSATDIISNGVTSGVALTEYRIDGGGWIIYQAEQALQLQEGIRTVEYRSIDNVNNTEEIKSITLYVDNTPPVTALMMEGSRYTKADGMYVTSGTTFTLTAEDPVVGDVSSGVKETKYRILSSTGVYEDWKLYQEENPPSSPFDKGGIRIVGPDGIYMIQYYSADNLENTEIVKSITMKLDNAPPETEIIANEPQYISEGKIYISPQTQIELIAIDPLINEVAVGVEAVQYRINAGEWKVYTGTITLTEGVRTIEYYAYDYLENTEQIKSQTYYVDGTPPLSAISTGEPQFEAFGLTIITPETQISLAANDPEINSVASGVNHTQYRIDPSTFTETLWEVYTGTFTLTEGEHAVEYRSIDNVNNTEAVKKEAYTVTYISKYAAYGEEGVKASGQGEIVGDVRSNGQVKVAGQAMLDGDASGETVEVDGTEAESAPGRAKITGEIEEGAEKINPWCIDLDAIEETVAENNNNEKLELKDGKLQINSNKTVTIT
ncbi:hypothetical protein FP828_02600, partial [bacterium]|nr:hypothetical protein [bacterium]